MGRVNDIAPRELNEHVYELANKYGADTLYQILGRDGQGNVQNPGAGVAAGGPLGSRFQDGLQQNMPAPGGSFPVRLYAPDPYDTEVKLKMDADPTIFGEKTLMQSDLDWLRRKQDQMTAAEFKQFVASMYNINDPAQLARMNKVYPELYDEQLKIVNERFDLAKRLAVMRLTGEPQSREDLQLLFALNTGAISLPVGNPWEPSTWGTQIAAGKNEAITRGIFSPMQGRLAGNGNKDFTPYNPLAWATTGARAGQAATFNLFRGAAPAPGGLGPVGVRFG